MWRLKGEAALLEGGRGDAAVCFGTALEIERKRGAPGRHQPGEAFHEHGKKEERTGLLADLSDLLDGPEADSTLPDIREPLELRRQLS